MEPVTPASAWLGLALVAATLALVALGLRPPAPLPADAPATAFAAARAIDTLARLAPEELPRPLPSPEHDRVRARLLAELTRLGLAPEERTGFVCGRFGPCASVTNVLARLPGARPAAVLLLAHYDSVAAGPGAADAGIGVASVLELTRALRAGPPLEHSLLLLFTDGEELGMLGARDFARHAPEAASVVAAVNLEARGTRGPSYVFRLGPDAASLVPALRLPRPVVSSVQSEAFRLLPNDTDLSELFDAGIPGFDLAFIGGVERYHTPQDARAFLEPRSVQHQGANALGLVRALDKRPPPRGEDRGGAVYFDVLSRFVVAWPGRLALPIALGVALAVVLTLAALLRARRLDRTSLVVGLIAWPATVLAALLLGAVGELVLSAAGAKPFPWVAHPEPALVAAAAIAVAALATAAVLTAPAGPTALYAGHLVWMSLLGILTATLGPGTSYLFVVPAAAGAVGALIWATLPEAPAERAATAAWVLPAVAGALVLGPVVLGLHDALGLALLPAHVLGLLLLALPCAPSLGALAVRHRKALALGAQAVVLGAFAVSALVPTVSAAVPRRTSLAYVAGPEGSAHLVADTTFGPLDPALAAGLGFAPETTPVPWLGSLSRAVVAPTPPLPLTPPTLAVLARSESSAGRSVHLRLRSPRLATTVALVLPATLPVEVHIDGEESVGMAHRSGRHYLSLTVPPEGVGIELSGLPSAPQPALLLDATPGLPPRETALGAERDERAVTSHFGDATVVAVRVEL